MTQTKTSDSHRVLLVDDDEAVRTMMTIVCDRYLSFKSQLLRTLRKPRVTQ